MYYTGTGTERLLFRPLTMDDIPLWAEFYTHPLARQHLVFLNGKTAFEASTHVIEKQIYRYENGLYGMYAVILKDTNELIGVGGLLLQHVNDVDELEVGYHLFPNHWHKGYATELARHFRDYGFNNKLAHSIISVINITNTPSQKVAINNNMKKDGTTIYEGIDHFIFRITRPEWEQLS